MHSRDDINNIMLTGDINQCLNHDRVKQFFLELGITDLFSTLYDIPLSHRMNTYVRDKNCIDTVACSHNMLPFMSNIQLLPSSSAVTNDHTAFIWKLESDAHFQVNSFRIPKPHHLLLDSNRQSHLKTFREKAEGLALLLELQNQISQLEVAYIPEILEFVDEIFTFILNKATSAAEGPNRAIPYSQIKLKVISAQRHWQKQVKIMTEATVDTNAMRQDEINGEVFKIPITVFPPLRKELTLIESKIATMMVQELKITADESRTEFLLDNKHADMDNSLNNSKAAKQNRTKEKILQAMHRKENRKHNFTYLSSTVGKGDNKALSRVIKYNADNQIEKIANDRYSVEKMVMNYNINHFKQAYSSEVCSDKIFPKLTSADVISKTLEGSLEKKDCTFSDVYDFLQLIKSDFLSSSKRYKPVTREEFSAVVKQAKRISTSSVFLKRTYQVYKCLLTSEYLTNLYVRFLNLTIKNGHICKRWLDIVDVITEKGKGSRLHKLRIIQLIEGDLQLLIRILVTQRTAVNAEKSSRLSTANYGNRKNFNIQTAILEKTLIHNIANSTHQPTIHYIDDRKSCYDRQLPEIGLLTQQSFGMHQREASFFCQILKNFNHYLLTACGISANYYGGHYDQLGKTGQENILSGEIYKNVTCLIFKLLENLELGINMMSPAIARTIMRKIIAFVDDADFFSCGAHIREKSQKLITKYNKLHGATAGTGQLEKNNFYLWRTIMNASGETEFLDILCDITVKNTTIKQLPCRQATKSLGVIYTPAADWNPQFEVMKEKMVEIIGKLMSTSVKHYQVHMFYHTYMVIKVCFECAVMELTDKQEDELREIYEIPILKKLGLSITYPRALLYVEREAMGLGLLRPNTILAQLSIKMFVGHGRIKSATHNSICVLHETIQFNAGISRKIAFLPRTQCYWNPTWVDNTYHHMRSRGIAIKTDAWTFLNISKKCTLMDMALRYTSEMAQEI